MVRACGEKRRRLRRKNDYGNESAMRQKRGMHKRRWLDRVSGDMKQKGLSGDEV